MLHKCSQVYLLDKRYVDPRRPKGALTADEKLEMLPAYTAELPFTPNLYASHKQAIEGLQSEASPQARAAAAWFTMSWPCN